MGQHLVGPAAAELPREAERASRAHDAAVEVEAGGRPAAGAVGAERRDAPGQARDARVEHHPGPDRHLALGPGLDDAPRRLVAEDEGEGAQAHQRGRGPGVVGEEMEVAPADPTGQHLDPGPRRPGQRGLGHLGKGGGERGIGKIEHDGAHAAQRRGRRRAQHAHGARSVTRRHAATVRTMRVPDSTLDELRDARGFSLLPGFLAPDELAAAQDALWRHFPRPDDYFADPDGRPTARWPATSSPACSSSRTARGTSTAWPCTPISSTWPSATSTRPTSTSTRSSCGASTPAPSTTTNRCTATTAATASSCPAPRPATSRSRRSSTSPTSPRSTPRP